MASERSAAGSGDDGADEIPVSPKTRALRIALVLLLDGALAGAGGYLIFLWWERGSGEKTLAPVTQPRVETARPSPSAPSAPSAPPAPAPAPAPPVAAAPSPPLVPEPQPKASPPPAAKPPAPLPAPTPVATARPAATPKPVPPRDVLPPRGGALPSKPADPGVMKHPKVGAAETPPPPPVSAGTPPSPPASEPPPPAAPDAPTAADHSFVEQMTAGIRQVVDDHRDAILDCYRRAAKGAPPGVALRGRLEIHLRILTAGDADEVRVVQNETGSTELGECLVSVMQSWRYPAPGAQPMEFVWPFTFRGQR